MLTRETYTLLSLYRLVWRGSQPTLTERLYLPSRLMDAFVTVDEELAQIDYERRTETQEPPDE